MIVPIGAMLVFIGVFAVATMRNVHLGILMFPTACAVGVFLAGMTLRDVVAGFPLNIMVLLVGVTYFFGIAQVNGTIDRVIGAALSLVGDRPAILPFVFFVLTGAIAAMGSPLAGLVLAPIGMPIARRSGVPLILMAIAINSGISAGGFAPTSLFGIVSYGVARQAGVEMSPLSLLTVAVIANFLLLIAAFVIFGRRAPHRSFNATDPEPAINEEARRPAGRGSFRWYHIATLACMAGLVISVIASALWKIDPDIGVLSFAFGALLTVLDPTSGRTAVSRIDWSTVLLVGGIITFVGVLNKAGSVDLLGQTARHVGTPFVAALLICLLGGLISAFASTTGILAVLVPLALPLVSSGGVPGWALICALGVCASIVDASPFSTTGATLVASASDDERPRLTSLLIRWAMSMIVVGPIALVGGLVIPSSW